MYHKPYTSRLVFIDLLKVVFKVFISICFSNNMFLCTCFFLKISKVVFHLTLTWDI